MEVVVLYFQPHKMSKEVLALFSYVAKREIELSFDKNDVFKVIDQVLAARLTFFFNRAQYFCAFDRILRDGGKENERGGWGCFLATLLQY